MSKVRKIICIVVVCLAVMAGPVCAGIYISYNNPVVREFTLATSKLDEPLTFVVLADLHDNEFGEDNSELAVQVKAEEPDAVFLVGDFVNKYSKDADGLLKLAEQLTESVPVYFTWGNHELGYMAATGDALKEELEVRGVVVLDETWQDVEINGQKIRIGGLYDYAFALDNWNSCNPENMKENVYEFLTEFQDAPDLGDTADTASEGGEDIFKIMLSHRPESFVLGEASVTWDIDLVVSGHVHGGQVVLPVLGGVFGGDQGMFPEYAHGLYEKDLIHIFVTSGLGSGNRKLIPRFNNPPEIAVLKLVPEEE